MNEIRTQHRVGCQPVILCILFRFATQNTQNNCPPPHTYSLALMQKKKMKSKQPIKFIAELKEIKIDLDLGKGIELKSNINNSISDKFENFHVYITNNQKIIKSLIDDNFELVAGKLEAHSILNAKVIVYSNDKFIGKDFNQITVLDIYLRLLKVFSLSLWNVKDNAVDFDFGFLEYPISNIYNLTSNYYSGINSTAYGLTKVTNFSKKELDTAIELMLDYYEIQEKEKIQTHFNSKSSNLSISNLFIQTARESHDLAYKIRQYCSYFETILSTDSSELTHKLSERVALFLSDDKDNRTKIFRDIKNAYKIRSQIVHGAGLKEKSIKDLDIIANKCDRYVRKINNKIFSTEEFQIMFDKKNTGKIDNYFLELIMSG